MIMTIRNIVARGIAIAIVMLPLAACDNSSSSGDHDANIDSGRVVSNNGKKIKVYEDDHEYDSYKVDKKTAKKCIVGKRWPDCKKGR